jgi:hypothetical protein
MTFTLDITWHKEEIYGKKWEKFNRALVVINQVFHPAKVQKHTRLSTYKALVRRILTYGSEVWTIRKQDEQRLTTAKMKFVRRTAGYSLLDHVRNKHIFLDKVKVTPKTEYVNNYRQNWLHHIKRMDRARIPKQMFQYSPHWTTTARKTEKKMVGDHNRPLGLILEWKIRMINFILFILHLHTPEESLL